MLDRITLASLLLVQLTYCAERGQEIKLWPQGAPGSEGITAAEVSKPSVNSKYSTLPGNLTVTHYPSIYVFLPSPAKATGAAMVVAPGGGHTQLVIEKEGWEFAGDVEDGAAFDELVQLLPAGSRGPAHARFGGGRDRGGTVGARGLDLRRHLGQHPGLRQRG